MCCWEPQASQPTRFSSIVPAKAQSRQETLLIVSESGPNNVDIHGVGTNVPGYEASWNCYDRLISHEMKTGANGVPYYDKTKFKLRDGHAAAKVTRHAEVDLMSHKARLFYTVDPGWTTDKPVSSKPAIAVAECS